MELMPVLEKEFRKGNRLDASIFANLNQANSWIKIPEWMAGTWLVKEETAVYRENYKTGRSTKSPHRFKAQHKFVYGQQKDRQGGIWHYVGTPYKSKTKLSSEDEIHLVKEKLFDPYNETSVRFKSVVNVIRVKRSSSIIKESYQQESITTYQPLDDGQDNIKLSASTKSFSEDGKPLFQADNEARVRKLSPYAPVDSVNGKDLNKLFRDFLVSSGRSNLLP